jgi:hypothetical protein
VKENIEFLMAKEKTPKQENNLFNPKNLPTIHPWLK